MSNFQQNINEVRPSIVAIGFNPNPQQITIVGSGFIIKDGKIITAAHLYNQINDEQRKNLKANVMVKQVNKDMEGYQWIPIELISKDDKNDLAVFKLLDSSKVLKYLEIDTEISERVEIGQEVFFIGFPYAAQLMNEGFGVTLVVNKSIVSNIKRDGVDQDHPRNWFIVDAISNPGNSGCPLIDMETNKVIGVMTIAFRTKSQTIKDLDIREPMHIAGAKPINLVKELLK